MSFLGAPEASDTTKTLAASPDISHLFVARRGESPSGKAAEAIASRAVWATYCPARNARPTPPDGLAASRSRTVVNDNYYSPRRQLKFPTGRRLGCRVRSMPKVVGSGSAEGDRDVPLERRAILTPKNIIPLNSSTRPSLRKEASDLVHRFALDLDLSMPNRACMQKEHAVTRLLRLIK